MKTFILLLVLVVAFAGCKDDKIGDRNTGGNTSPVPEPKPEPTNTPEQTLYLCSFNDGISFCNINDYAKPRLIQLSTKGTFTSKMLELKEVKEKYNLTDENVKCLKENFCKEEY